MKKYLKKLAVLLMSFVMTLGMSAAVYAADAPTTATLTMNGAEGASYTAYKVMDAVKEASGTDSEGNTTYVNTYTVSSAFSGFFDGSHGYTLSADNEILDSTGAVVATDGLTYAKDSDGHPTNYNNQSAAALLAKALSDYAEENNISGTSLSSTNTLDIGLYLIRETATTKDGAVASKPVLVDLTEDKTVNPKDDVTFLEKVIREDNQDKRSNNVNIGDTVNYEGRTIIPTYAANETNLVFKLTDTFSEGLTSNKDVKVYVNDTLVEAGTSTYQITTNTDNSFVIEFASDYIAANGGKSVKLVYSAVLNAKAKVDSTEGNPNDLELEYTNNPATGTDSLTDHVTTYTYGFKIHKVDKNDETKDMAGAEFRVKNLTTGEVIGTFTYGDDGSISTDGNIQVSLSGNYATLTGLDAGQYEITELKAPVSYSMLSSPVVVEITDEGGTTPNGKADISIVSGFGTAETSVENNDGAIDLTVKIVNARGISLPETGSRTAMIVLIAGAALLVLGFASYAAGTRKRNKN